MVSIISRNELLNKPRQNLFYKLNGTILKESSFRPVKIKNGKVYESLSEICSGIYYYSGQEGFLENKNGGIGPLYSAGDSLYVRQFTSLDIWPAGHDGQDISYGSNYGVPEVGWIDYFGYIPDRNNPKFGDCGIDNKGNLWLNYLMTTYIPSLTNTYKQPGVSFYLKMKTNLSLDDLQFGFGVSGNGTLDGQTLYIRIKKISGYYGIKVDNTAYGQPPSFTIENTTNTISSLDITSIHSYFFKIDKNKVSVYIDFVLIGEVDITYTYIVAPTYSSGFYIGRGGSGDNLTLGLCIEQIAFLCENIPTIDQLKKIARYN